MQELLEQHLRLVLDLARAHVALALQLARLLQHVARLAARIGNVPTVDVGAERHRGAGGFRHLRWRTGIEGAPAVVLDARAAG